MNKLIKCRICGSTTPKDNPCCTRFQEVNKLVKDGKDEVQKFLSKNNLQKELGYDEVVIGKYGVFVRGKTKRSKK